MIILALVVPIIFVAAIVHILSPKAQQRLCRLEVALLLGLDGDLIALHNARALQLGLKDMGVQRPLAEHHLFLKDPCLLFSSIF